MNLLGRFFVEEAAPGRREPKRRRAAALQGVALPTDPQYQLSKLRPIFHQLMRTTGLSQR